MNYPRPHECPHESVHVHTRPQVSRRDTEIHRITLVGCNARSVRVCGAAYVCEGRFGIHSSGSLGAGGRRFKSSRPDLESMN